MNKIKVVTGFGYLQDINGNIIAKCELLKGENNIKEGYTYVELISKEELDKISVYISEETIKKLSDEKKIQDEIRQIAVERLKARGEIT